MFQLLLTEAMDNRANSGLNKKLGRKGWRMRCFGDLEFENLRHAPRDVKGHAHTQGCEHAQGRLERALADREALSEQ